MTDQRNEDQALVARIARGDRSALEQLYRRHAGSMTALLAEAGGVALSSACALPRRP